MIVDDEQQTREGLRRFIEKQSMGIQRIMTAPSAMEALAIVEEHHPHIIISDIVMPGMDGIQFVKQCCEMQVSSRVIMISGHSQVEYLKSAIKLNVVDYILKPIDIKELLQVLKKVIHDIKEKQRVSQERVLIQQKLDESLPALREKFLLSLLDGGYTDSQSVLDKCVYLGLDQVLADSFVVVDIHTHEEACDPQQVMASIRSHLPSALTVTKGQNEFVAIHPMGSLEVEETCIRDKCHAIKEQLHADHGATVTIGIGVVVKSLVDIPASYQASVEAVHQQFLLGKGHIIFYSEIEKHDRRAFHISKAVQGELLQAIYARDMGAVERIMHSIFQPLYLMHGLSNQAMDAIRVKLIELVVKVINDTKIAGQQEDTTNVPWRELLNLSTLKDIEQWLMQKFRWICGSLDANMDSKSTKIIHVVKSMVREHYDRPLNVQIISQDLRISPNYLSALFKKETGIKFTEYLSNIRMEKAKSLMENPELKIYEIGHMVGYEDHNYFSRQFKKAYGVSPTTYREMM